MEPEIELTEHQVLLEQGGASDVVYFVVSGELEAYAETGGRTTVLGRIAAGEYVGELGVLQGQPRGASVRAITPARLRVHSREAFIELLANDHDHCLKMMHSLSLRTRTLLDLVDEINREIQSQRPSRISRIERWWLGFFHWLKRKLRGSKTVLETPAEKLKSGRLRLKADEVLFREGHESLVACRVLSGKLKVVRSSGALERKLGLVGPGEFVGEIGLLEGTPRSATVKAVVRSEVEVFDQAGLHRLIEQDREAGKMIVATLSSRALRLGHDCQALQQEFATKLDRPTQARINALLKAAGEAYELTGERVERDLTALQRGMTLEAAAARSMMRTYYRHLKKEATPEQMAEANADFRNLLKSLGLGTLLILPGAPITIPAAIKAAKSFGIDLLPKSREDEDQPPSG